MESAGTGLSSVVLNSAARYITSILRTFGLSQDGCEIGFPMAGSEAEGASKEQVLTPFLDILTEFRKNVRVAAIGSDSQAVLNLVDRLRDEVLPELGVRMEDRGSGASADTVWKLEDPEALRKERSQKEAARLAKEEQKLEAAKIQARRDEQAKVDPRSMFLHLTDQYSAFDENGMPTKDAVGEPLSKGVLKKLQKDFGKQQEAHEKYLAKQGGAAK